MTDDAHLFVFSRRSKLFLLCCATAVLLLPFVYKAFHIDDPIFLWPAERIAAGDARPLAGQVNWYDFTQTLAQVTNHPLLLPYVLAGLAHFTGFSEPALHGAMLLFSMGAVAGIYLLAEQLGTPPLLTVALVLLSPAFLVSATSVMSDVPMLCCWIWSVVIWLRSRQSERAFGFLLAGAFISAAVMTKYPAIALVPLLATQIGRRGLFFQLAGLLLPIAVLLAWQVSSARVYGHGVVGIAIDFAEDSDGLASWPARIVTGLSFLGGCLPATAAILFVQATNRFKALTAAVCAGFALAVLSLPEKLLPLDTGAEPHRSIITAHVLLFSASGLIILLSATRELYLSRSRTAVLIGFWIFGVFTFATLINWTTNVRSMLPLVPAAALCAARGKSIYANTSKRWFVGVTIVLSAVLSLSLAAADWQIADASKQAAERISSLARASRAKLWFSGHWGFQWYMEHAGASALDPDRSLPRAHDLLAGPLSSVLPLGIPRAALQTVDIASYPIHAWVRPQCSPGGPSFYASGYGPIPYTFSFGGPQRFVVYRLIQNVRLSPPATQPAKP